MKRLTFLLIFALATLACAREKLGYKLSDRLNININARIGMDYLGLDVPDEIKYTPAHTSDQPGATMGAYHHDPDLVFAVSGLTAGLELRITDDIALGADFTWYSLGGSSRDQQEYPPYNSYTYLDADVSESWLKEPYTEIMWTFYQDRSARCSLAFGVGWLSPFKIEYERGWYRWGGYQLDAAHSAEVDARTYYIRYDVIFDNDTGVLLQIHRRDWEGTFDTGHRSRDTSYGFAIGFQYRL